MRQDYSQDVTDSTTVTENLAYTEQSDCSATHVPAYVTIPLVGISWVVFIAVILALGMAVLATTDELKRRWK